MKCYVTWGNKLLTIQENSAKEAAIKAFRRFYDGTIPSNKIRVSSQGFTKRESDIIIELDEVIEICVLQNNRNYLNEPPE